MLFGIGKKELDVFKNQIKDEIELKFNEKLNQIRDEIELKNQFSLKENLEENLKKIKQIELKYEKLFSSLKENNLEKINHVLKLNKELLNVIIEVVENDDIEQDFKDKRANDLKVINKNFNIINDKVSKISKELKSLDEIAQRIVRELKIDEDLIDIFSENVTLQKIIKRKNNKTLLYGILYLLKKTAEGKGIRI